MRILNVAIAPLCLASFIMFAIQYAYLTFQNLEGRLLRLGFMVGMVILILVSVAFPNSSVSPIFFLLALLSLGLAIYLFRNLRPFRQ
jgi:hypothetical protein